MIDSKLMLERENQEPESTVRLSGKQYALRVLWHRRIVVIEPCTLWHVRWAHYATAIRI